MATSKETIEDLRSKIAQLEKELASEKKRSREILGLDEHAPDEKVMPTWSTEWMQDEMDKCEVVDGIVSKVYDQHAIKLTRSKAGVIQVRYHNGKRAKKELLRYKKVKFTILPEAFFILLELFKYAEREFDMNQKEIVDKMTNGEGIKIRRSINGFW